MSYQRDEKRRLRLGVVGVGGHSYRTLLPALHYLPVKLVALCDIDEQRLASAAAEYRVDATYTSTADMYAEQEYEMEAVLICVGPRLHPSLAVEALKAGLHVWLEKPPAVRASEVRDILAARGERVCAVGFKKACMPAIRKAGELIAGEQFGPLRSILGVYRMEIPTDGAGVLERGEVCDWLSNGVHPLSAMIELGGPVRSVQAVLGDGPSGVGSVNLRYASGAVGVLFLAGGAPAGWGFERYQAFGRGRAVTIDNASRVVYHRGMPFDYARQRDFFGPGDDSGSVVWEASNTLATLENRALFLQGFVDELDDFCPAVLDGRPLRTCGLDFALHVMEVYEAALRSGGEEIDVPSEA